MTPRTSPPPGRPGWAAPRPARVPAPTWSPAALAFGLALLALGLITSGIVLGAGGLLSAAALVAWIRELRHDLRDGR